MALGGYKFKGYRYNVPSDFDSSDDTQVKAQCLEMFKCRLKAFTESCLASGADWEFSYTDGDYSFGSYGDVIYDLDGDGYNHGAFLKYHGREQYMMLMNYQSGDILDNFFMIKYSTNTNYYDICTAKSSIGLLPFTPDNWKDANLGKRLRLRGTYGPNNMSSSYVPNIRTTVYGFATKGCDVVEINSISSGTYRFKVMSPDGFATLCSPGDVAPVFDYAGYGTRTYNISTYNYILHLNYYPIQILRSDGSKFPYTLLEAEYLDNHGNYPAIFSQPEAYYRSSIDHVPYASPLITQLTYGEDITNYCINNDGIMSKGYVKPELMAINSIRPYSQMVNLNLCKPYANGNYILAEIFYTSNSNNAPTSNRSYHDGAIYVGWDPSNPDITQAASWENYN